MPRLSQSGGCTDTARHELIVDWQSFAVAPQSAQDERATVLRHHALRITRHSLIGRRQRFFKTILRAQYVRQEIKRIGARGLRNQCTRDVFSSAHVTGGERGPALA